MQSNATTAVPDPDLGSIIILLLNVMFEGTSTSGGTADAENINNIKIEQVLDKVKELLG